MGHADHFPPRLDRLASAEVELALQLYLAPELLGAVLKAVQLPHATERVAIAPPPNPRELARHTPGDLQ